MNLANSAINATTDTSIVMPVSGHSQNQSNCDESTYCQNNNLPGSRKRSHSATDLESGAERSYDVPVKGSGNATNSNDLGFRVHWLDFSDSSTTETTNVSIDPTTVPESPTSDHCKEGAIIVAVRDTIICLKGCGRIRNNNSNQMNEAADGQPSPPTAAAAEQQRIMEIHGYKLHPNSECEFESASWSSWITISLACGDQLHIYSRRKRCSSSNNNNNISNRDSTTSHLPSGGASFEIYAATHREARPTILPDSWRCAVENIAQDYTMRVAEEQKQTRKQREYQQNHLYSTASFFQESVVAVDGYDRVTSAGHITNDTDCASQHSGGYNWSNDGYQIVVCGAKGVGKSTCLRYCMNHLLNVTDAVAVLDADPGQPEYTVPGMLQLTIITTPNLVPPHRHLVQEYNSTSDQQLESRHEISIIEQHYFGSVTTSSDPVTYMQCVSSLLNTYKELWHHSTSNEGETPLPLLINLDGWIKDLGFEILTALIQDTLQPRHVIQISGDSLSKALNLSDVFTNPGRVLHQCLAYNVHRVDITMTTNSTPDVNHKKQSDSEIVETSNSSPVATRLHPSSSSVASRSDYENGLEDSQKGEQPTENLFIGNKITPSTSYIPAAILRDIRLVTYFMTVGIGNDDDTWRDEVDSLWDTVAVSSHGMDDSARCLIGKTLAAARPYAVSIDAIRIRFTVPELCHDIVSEERVLDAINGSLVGLCQIVENPQKQGNVLLPCIGLGLVRSVDLKRRLLFIITPVSTAKVQSVNCLTIGTNVNLPVQCFFRGTHAEAFPYISFLDSNVLDLLGGDPMKSRNNINRRGRSVGGGG
jgi:polynucleotide 5'-kinase involved in rRNA processing